jgi:hypothetical protein
LRMPNRAPAQSQSRSRPLTTRQAQCVMVSQQRRRSILLLRFTHAPKGIREGSSGLPRNIHDHGLGRMISVSPLSSHSALLRSVLAFVLAAYQHVLVCSCAITAFAFTTHPSLLWHDVLLLTNFAGPYHLRFKRLERRYWTGSRTHRCSGLEDSIDVPDRAAAGMVLSHETHLLREASRRDSVTAPPRTRNYRKQALTARANATRRSSWQSYVPPSPIPHNVRGSSPSLASIQSVSTPSTALGGSKRLS